VVTSQAQGWLEPRLATRTGAAHQRKGIPCQDASGSTILRDREGDVVQVLVVSDGHGGRRYRRSDTGSRLACAVALAEVERALASAATREQTDDWRAWLSEALPQKIVAAWHREVKAHWRAHPSEDEPEFSSVSYGATLGLLVLTPHWWGHSGLGDWDLVRVSARGSSELVSEEPEREGSGEATFSLCMERSERHFAPRSALFPLGPVDAAFQLLLSTDGIRKSCGSDSDFLTLAAHLVTLPAAGPEAGEQSDLGEALDHISREGSGDDVSVAIASRKAGEAAGAAWPVGAAALILQPPPPSMAQELPGSRGPEVPAGPPSPAPAFSQPSPHPAAGWLPKLMAVLATGLAAAAATLVAWKLRLGPFAQAPSPAPPTTSIQLTGEQRDALRRQVEDLCRKDPEMPPPPPDGVQTELAQRISSNLNPRRSTFRRLATATPAQSAEDLHHDPLTALIALSHLEPSLAALGPVCPELRQELKAQWARLMPSPNR
jgi:hypothetical protein